MNIFVVSKSGDSAALWHRMKSEGHNVFVYIKEPDMRDVAEGMIEKVSSIEEGMKKNPLYVLFDMSGMGKEADEIRKQGKKVIGASEFADKLEMDRSYGVSVAKQYGLSVPETTEFKTVEEAINHIKKTKGTFAIKIDNNKSEMSSYVSKSPEDMIDYLTYSKEEGKIDGDTFILQAVISGAEVSTEGWFCEGKPIYSGINSTWETKKFLAAELGQRTGAETSVVCHYDGHSKLYDGTIRKIEPLLKYSKWTGPIDVNVIVEEKSHKPYFLEWTPRLGYSAIYAYTSILSIGIGEFFRRIAFGGEITYKNRWGTSLKLSVPPYPVDIEDPKMSKVIYGGSAGMVIKGADTKDFLLIDAMKKKNRIVTSGTTGIVGEAVGRSDSLLDAWKASKGVFDKVDVPNRGGRYLDGIDDAWKRIGKLREMKYLDIPNAKFWGGGGKFINPLNKSNPSPLSSKE